MKQETRARIEARLRYYEDLGIRLFYLDRAPVAPGFSPARPAAAPGSRDAGPPASSAVSARSAPGGRSFSSDKTSAPLRGGSAPEVLPVIKGPSLFEAAERIEGDTLELIRADIGDCTRCNLHKGRQKIVFGVGNPKAELVFVGEGPGHDEDVQGIPFVGRAGKLLTDMIEKGMGLRRDDVYICNVVKCRPPENRLPERDEIATCSPFLLRQLAAIQPKVIVCLGACAAQTLLSTNRGISHFRGEWFDFRGARLIATYHPAYLLRNPAAKPEVWKDLQKVMGVLGLKPPPRPRS